MVINKRSIGILLICGLGLIGCETTNPQENVKIKSPMAFLGANKDVSPPVAQAFQLIKEEKYGEASKVINCALQSQPKSMIFHLLNGFTYEKLAERGDAGGLEMAAIGYQNAINLDSSNTYAMSQLGKINYREKKYAEAQENFANALLVKPDDTDLLQELAASSYYAYDIQTALAAIDKAVKLKPEDPLINRSAAMIHAALGDLPTAKKYIDVFQAKVGKDPAVDQLMARYNDWASLYNSGRLSLAASTSSSGTSPPTATIPPKAQPPASPPAQPPAQSPVPPPPLPPVFQGGSGGAGAGGGSGANGGSSDGSSDGDDSSELSVSDSPNLLQGDQSSSSSLADTIVDVAEKPETMSPHAPQIVVDCYLLTILEDARTSKGTNIMNNLAVTLSPGGLTAFKGKMTGSGTTGVGPGGTFQNTAASNATNAAANIINLNQNGSMSGNIFTAGITWAGLTYNLNIANAVNMRTQVVSRPTLMTFLNKETTFFSGDQLVFGISGQYGGNLLKYNLGLTVVITPVSLKGDEVGLNVNIEGSLPTSANTNLSTTVGVSLTTLSTHAKMRLGETLMLGGMYTNVDLTTKDGFPGLQDVPLVQYFFSNETTRSLRRSVLLMITPRSPEMLKSAVNRSLARNVNRPNVDELANRHPDWFSTHPNLVPILRSISRDPVTYYEFRTGDVLPPSWDWDPPVEEQLSKLASFLYF